MHSDQKEENYFDLFCVIRTIDFIMDNVENKFNLLLLALQRDRVADTNKKNKTDCLKNNVLLVKCFFTLKK